MTTSVPDRPQLGPCVNPDCDADDECCCPGDRGFIAAPSRDGGPVDDEAPDDLRYEAWCLLANGAYWDQSDAKRSADWNAARDRWRDRWHAHLARGGSDA